MSKFASDFWFGSNADIEYTASSYSLIRMASFRRAVANFVRIVTGEDIPVVFNVKDDSFTDGNRVVLSANIPNAQIDAAVGLALHEAVHILRGDTNTNGWWENLGDYIPSNVYKKAMAKKDELELTEKIVAKRIKRILNWCRDRSNDLWYYKEAPGYKPYYDALYRKYFYRPVIDVALRSSKFRTPSWKGYNFRIWNITNEHADLDALPGLRDILEILDLKTIDKYDNVKDMFPMVLNIWDVVIENLINPPKVKRPSGGQETEQMNDAETDELDEELLEQLMEQQNDQCDNMPDMPVPDDFKNPQLPDDTEYEEDDDPSKSDSSTTDNEQDGTSGQEESEDKTGDMVDESAQEPDETDGDGGEGDNDNDDNTESNNSNGANDDTESDETKGSGEETDDSEGSEKDANGNDGEENDDTNGVNDNKDDENEKTDSNGSEGDDDTETTDEDENISEGQNSDDNDASNEDDSKSENGDSADDADESNSSDSDNNGDKEEEHPDPSNHDEDMLEKAINKQNDFLDNGVEKDALNNDQSALLKQIEKSGASVEDTGKEFGTIKTVVIRKLTSDILNGLDLGNDEPVDISETGVLDGIRLGKVLGNKLQVRNDSTVTEYNRKITGKLDKRMVHAVGYLDSVCKQVFVDEYGEALIHVSIDASSSMYGSKWTKAMTTAVAIAKATDIIPKLNVIISFRGTTAMENGYYAPLVVIAYDSRVDKFAKVRQLFPRIYPNAATPEGLCFEAIMDDIIQSVAGKEGYFINVSDGEPYFGNYSGHRACVHTAKQVKKMRDSGISILSFFVEDNNRYWGDGSQSDFKKMYGKNASFIDVTQMTSVAREMNTKLLQKK